jgi:glutamate synthase domain-containing protein 3
MTGGEAFVHDAAGLLDVRLNGQLVVAEQLGDSSAEKLRGLIERHREYTGSTTAARLLAEWPVAVSQFRLVRPKDEVRRIEAEAEGTDYEEAEAESSDAGVAIP